MNSELSEDVEFDHLWYENDQLLYEDFGSSSGYPNAAPIEDHVDRQVIRVAPRTSNTRFPAFLHGYDCGGKVADELSVFKEPNGPMARMAQSGSQLVVAKRLEKERMRAVKRELGLDKQVQAADSKREAKHQPKLSTRKQMLEKKASLPANQDRHNLLSLIESHQVTIIVGETGSGKTTQLPQILKDAGFCDNGRGIVGCTQPRRIAATSVAQRVANERGCLVGQEVGYTIRFEDMTSNATKIKFMTDGILLRELIEEPFLDSYSCIIIDEAHERSLNSDLLMGSIKTILANRLDFRLIVTSASIDAVKFSQFYGGAPVYEITGRTFPVDIHNLRSNPEDYVVAAAKQVMSIHLQQPEGDILVFMTGQEDIEATIDEIERKKKILEDCPPLLILPLYSQLPSDTQRMIFEPTEAGVRKVVVSTNIAETSLTIDGIKYVIDTGLVKLKVYKPRFSMEVLEVVPISKAAALQRAGRAGRTSRGIAYRLFTKSSEETELFDNNIPEIRRNNLENTVLLLKALGIDDIFTFAFLDVPETERINQSLYNLWILSALDNDGKLTNLGRDLLKLPSDPLLSRFILASVEEECSEEVTIIAAMLSVPPVVARSRDRHSAKGKSLERFQSLGSDHLMLLNIFRSWIVNKMSSDWAKEHGLVQRSLIAAEAIRGQFQTILLKKFNSDLVSCGKNLDRPRRCLAAAYFHQAARRTGLRSYLVLMSSFPSKPYPYSALSSLAQMPDYVIYHELVFTSQQYMSVVTAVEPEWLIRFGSRIYYDMHDEENDKDNHDADISRTVSKSRGSIGRITKSKSRGRTISLARRGI